MFILCKINENKKKEPNAYIHSCIYNREEREREREREITTRKR
jgi:hypothetical protein